jgi:hypothetical protein
MDHDRTNILIVLGLDKDLNAVLKELSEAVSTTTGEYSGYVVVHIVPDQVNHFTSSADRDSTVYQ